jgi:hypothetical protein
MTETDKIVKHPTLAKAEAAGAENLRRRLLEVQRRAFAPRSNYELEAMILDLRKRVAALEAERPRRRRRP